MKFPRNGHGPDVATYLAARTKRGPDCWEWIGPANNNGYAQMSGLGEHKAHRVAWVLAYGPIPDGKWVLHHCDNRRCVRPEHLYLGDNATNTADRVRRGRNAHVYGERNGLAKLTAVKVRAIRLAISLGERPKTVAARFGITASNVSYICSRKTWADA